MAQHERSGGYFIYFATISGKFVPLPVFVVN